MKAILFQNLRQFPSVSMKRYAAELYQAMGRLGLPEWQLELFQCEHVEAVAKALPSASGLKLAERLGRLVKYPFLASGAKADILHILDHSHAHLLLGMKASKTIITCHDLIPLRAIKGLLDVPVSNFTRLVFPLRVDCLRRCAAVIADSESTKRDLVNLAGVSADNIHVVHLGVDPLFCRGLNNQADRAAVATRYGIEPDSKIVLQVASQDRQKNTGKLLVAMKDVISQMALPVHLLRAGDRLTAHEIALAKQLGIAERIIQAEPRIDDVELRTLYRAADVFAFPSQWEGFGLPPLEAMACGTPVVAGNVASLPEVIGDAGLLVDPKSHEDIAAAVMQILNVSDLSNKLSQRGERRARQFTWEQTARKTIEVYGHVANRGGRNN